ncbi:MAG: hypothetical protein O7C59_03880 [Rickettsia endosymbiont of Ixodes persulcatus]|nr:hypothetical protein [Rickettsia endosymbiont of Ixodes persulcatus]MCZ6901422.1 hypothetical protein [Rickettsia endosymbiont of Ixodes persulcatus]MCZ6903984.1 hypothetical protein [Rickettsia endosymbiont of Ixodes persulcatus]MCZ6908370.1 hypothetical protein [Rickettsia endosymbiont of Ixodes persulcatus]MCZ6911131.1 hypothetical protein [Rickettsia endosymbiont of Ixodes persulcatus]
MQEKEELLKKQECDEKAGYRLGELEQVIDNEGYVAEIFATS